MYLDDSAFACVHLAWQFVTQKKNSTIADMDKKSSQNIINGKHQGTEEY